MKIANRDARSFVQKEHPFQGNNLFAEYKTLNNPDGTNGPGLWYVVYSYGVHWPLFICANGVWFENEDRHSVTTSKHRSQTHPHCPTILLSTEWMKKLAQGGYQALVKARVIEGVAL
jgi:hypothetical protein